MQQPRLMHINVPPIVELLCISVMPDGPDLAIAFMRPFETVPVALI